MGDSATKDDRAFEVATSARQFELQLFWQRSLFFWGFISASLVGVGTAQEKQPMLALAIGCFGGLCSFCWTLVNRGSKYWYESWETRLKSLGDKSVNKLFDTIAPTKRTGIWWWAARYSVSRATIALSDYTTLLWGCLVVYQVMKLKGWWKPEYTEIAVLVGPAATLIYAAVIVVVVRRGTPKE